MMKKILIIEDDAVVGHIYRSRLEKEGYEVLLATDGQSGFYEIQTKAVDAVLLDLMLPKMSGIEVLKKIRAQAQFQKLPVVVFTNAYVTTMIQEAALAGATAIYDKSALTPRLIADALHGQLFRPPPETAASPASPALSVPSAPVSQVLSMVSESEVGGVSELTRNFYTQSPEHLANLRRLLQEWSKAQAETTQQGTLSELFREARSLSSKAGLSGLRPVAQTASALEAMLRELVEKPKSATPSTMRTVANTLDLLKDLSVPGVRADLVDNPPLRILVVDDDLISRRALTFALQKSLTKPDSADNSEAALKMAAQQPYDVIFLDVLMPGMDGFALCGKIRLAGPNKTTPIIFVTSQADFTARAQSTLSGGNDVIAKPFPFIEVTVKALTFALRGRLLQSKTPAS